MSPLILIVAATPKWGIGKGGSLPWPALKQEMAYFARVTKRLPSSPPPSNHVIPKPMNAVIMGRKTWESIPSRSRPLKDRINIVLSRTPEALQLSRGNDNGGFLREGPFAVAGVPEALSFLESAYSGEFNGFDTPAPQLGRVFIIGGGEIYRMALQLNSCNRILLTRVAGDWECDTFFPIQLEESEGRQGSSQWRKQTLKDLGDWVGEDLGDARREEDEVSWQWEMWIREPCDKANE